MDSTLNDRHFPDSTLLDEGRLRAASLAELWRLWWRVGRVLLARVPATLSVWWERSRQRDDLPQADLRMLLDIGLTEEQARREARKPFWLD
jgi:uncharacterized protein YjiS (DUF1127 family)